MTYRLWPLSYVSGPFVISMACDRASGSSLSNPAGNSPDTRGCLIMGVCRLWVSDLSSSPDRPGPGRSTGEDLSGTCMCAPDNMREFISWLKLADCELFVSDVTVSMAVCPALGSTRGCVTLATTEGCAALTSTRGGVALAPPGGWVVLASPGGWVVLAPPGPGSQKQDRIEDQGFWIDPKTFESIQNSSTGSLKLESIQKQ